MKFSQEKEQKIIELYNQGLNTVQIGKTFNTFNTSIRRVLLRNNIVPKNQTERNRMFEPTFFNDYSNLDIQYWLGVLSADGCITKGSLILETIDKDWMEDYRNFLNPDININITLPKKGQMLYRVSARIKDLDKELKKYGIVPNKSLDLEWKFPITKDYFRGVFDGDGHVRLNEKNNSVTTVNICSGSLKFITQLQQFLNNNNIKNKIVIDEKENKNNLYYLFVDTYESKLKLFHLLYDNSKYFLKRKYDKFQHILKNKDLRKKVKVINLNDNREHNFNSIVETADFLNLNSRKLSYWLSHNKNSYKNYLFELKQL